MVVQGETICPWRWTAAQRQRHEQLAAANGSRVATAASSAAGNGNETLLFIQKSGDTCEALVTCVGTIAVSGGQRV